MKRMMIR